MMTRTILNRIDNSFFFKIILLIFLLPSPPLLAYQLEISTEVQTSMPTMWQIGPRLDFPLAAFPSRFLFLFFHPFLHVLEWIFLSSFVFGFFSIVLEKKKTFREIFGSQTYLES